MWNLRVLFDFEGGNLNSWRHITACAFLVLGVAWGGTAYASDTAMIGTAIAQFCVSALTDQDPPASAPVKAEKVEPAEGETPPSEAPQADKPTQSENQAPQSITRQRPQISPQQRDFQGRPQNSAPAGIASQQQDADAKAHTSDSGCGTKPGDTTPTPSPDGPQPVFVCKETKVDVGELWRGANAEFNFTIGNEGEGELHIRLKGG